MAFEDELYITYPKTYDILLDLTPEQFPLVSGSMSANTHTIAITRTFLPSRLAVLPPSRLHAPPPSRTPTLTYS